MNRIYWKDQVIECIAWIEWIEQENEYVGKFEQLNNLVEVSSVKNQMEESDKRRIKLKSTEKNPWEFNNQKRRIDQEKNLMEASSVRLGCQENLVEESSART